MAAKWEALSPREQGECLRNMLRFGGDFAKALAEAWIKADPINDRKLGEAFPEIVERYAPTPGPAKS